MLPGEMGSERTSRTPSATETRCRRLAMIVACAVVVAGAAAVARNPKEYVASATLVIVDPPSIPELEAITNTTIDPTTRSWLANYGDPTVVADIFAEIYRGRSKGDELRAEGVVGQLVVLTKPSAASVEAGHGPVVLLGVITPVPADAIQQLEIVVADFVRELADRQQGANPSMTVTAAIAASSTQPTLVAGSRLRSALGWVLLGVIVWLLSYAAAERWLPHATGHRRNRQLTTRFAPKLHFREH